MGSEIPATIVALGSGVKPWKREWKKNPEQFGDIIGINNSHHAYDFKPTLIIAMDDLQRDLKTHPDYVSQIVDEGVPVLTADPHDFPNCWSYPVKEVVDYLKWPEASRVLDNTCNYAIAYCLMKGYREIHLIGYQWVHPDIDITIEAAESQCSENDPDWVKYYRGPLIRKPSEPGQESCAFLIGLGCGMGVDIDMTYSVGLFDRDRPAFFYGYQEQPDIS
jgi:hypothetical protein